MGIEFLEPAYIELEEAIEYYNFQLDGLGKRFYLGITQILEIIKKYPQAFPQYSVNTRKATLNIYPFNIIYTIKDNKIIIVAISHQNRKPNYWQERIK